MPKKGQTWTPEQRAKILAAKQQKATADVPAPEAVSASPPPPRQRAQYAPRPEKPSGSRWTMKAGRWDEGAMEDVAGEGSDILRIAPEDIPEGITLQWVRDSVYGQPDPQNRAKFERAGWLAVHPEDFDHQYEGTFSPRGATGEINKDGLVLMAKPSEMVKKSKQRDVRRAREQVQIKEQALYGGEIDAMGADHPSAKRFNHIRRSTEKISIPQDD
jgi:hypothetical protein